MLTSSFRSLFLTVLLVGLASSSLIYENVPFDIYKQKFQKELSKIDNMKYFQKIELAEYTYKTEKGYDITVDSFTPVANILIPEMFEFSYTAGEPNSFTISYTKPESASYSAYKINFNALVSSMQSLVDATVYKFSFRLLASKYSLTKSYEKVKDKEYFLPKGTADITFSVSEIKTEDGCPISIEDIKVTLEAMLTERTAEIVKGFNEKAVNAYYQNPSSLTQNVYTNTATLVSIAHNIDISMSEEPEITTVAVVNKYNGQIVTPSLHVLTNKVNLHPFGEEPTYQIAIDDDAFERIIKDGLFSIKLEESTRPIDKYTLTIASMSKICSELSSLYDPKLELTAETTMTGIDFKEDIDTGIAGMLSLSTDLKSVEDKSVVLSFSWTIDYTFDFIISQHGINFFLDAHILDVNNIKENPEPKRTITDEDLLEKWLEETLVIALAKKEYDLFARSIDMGVFFKRNADIKMEIKGEYYFISGNPKI